jgi:hypothetical protein
MKRKNFRSVKHAKLWVEEMIDAIENDFDYGDNAGSTESLRELQLRLRALEAFIRDHDAFDANTRLGFKATIYAVETTAFETNYTHCKTMIEELEPEEIDDFLEYNEEVYSKPASKIERKHAEDFIFEYNDNTSHYYSRPDYLYIYDDETIYPNDDKVEASYRHRNRRYQRNASRYTRRRRF